ncbi:MAG: hypothetical protein JW940_31355, partial [Polyangiaceae bacterium]|nr:hypothetical protein [Polyangiaceae bacterium]
MQLRFDERNGGLMARVDPNGIPEQWAYDGFGRLTASSGPEGSTSVSFSLQTDPTELLIKSFTQVQSPDGHQATYGLDRLGRKRYSRETGYGGVDVLQSYEYDAFGRLAAVVRPHVVEGDGSQGVVTYQYDGWDRLVGVVNADGTTRSIDYAAEPGLSSQYRTAWTASVPVATQVVRTTDELSHQSVLVYDYKGKLLRNIDAGNVDSSTPSTTDLAYGPFDQLARIVDNMGNETVFEYDDYGRRTGLTDPDSGHWSYTYTPHDELETVTDAADNLTSFVYDSLGRLKERTAVFGDRYEESSWTYDGLGPNEIGRLTDTHTSTTTSTTSSGYHVRYLYEPPSATYNRGLLQGTMREVDGESLMLETHVEYDEHSRIARLDYPAPDDVVVSVQYDYNGPFVSAVRDVTGGDDRVLWQMQAADDQGYRIGTEYFGTSGATTSYEYEPLTGLLSQALTTANGTQLQELAYGYEANGLVRDRVFSPNASQHYVDHFEYDERNRLVQAGYPSAFVYDEIGNITLKPDIGPYAWQDTDPPHLPSNLGQHTYHYDTRGNVTSRDGPEVPQFHQAFSYTSFDLPSEVTTGFTNPVVTHLEYDADQTRVLKWTDDTRTYYVDDLYRATLTETPISQVEHRYLVYVGDRQVAEMVRLDGEPTPSATYDLFSDILGSPMTITDGANTYTQYFDPFGEYGVATDNTTGVITGFTGHYHDPELGLINMKGRMYDPAAGRFLSADPILNAGSTQGLNPYSYVYNDPINRTDPSGFWSWSDPAVGVTAWAMFVVGAAAIAGPGVAALAGPGAAAATANLA